MLYLYGDESNTPGADKIWAIGFIFSTNPSAHMQSIQGMRKTYGFKFREFKYSSTDYSQILFRVKFLDYFLDAQDIYFKIIIKDNLYFDRNYFSDNHYDLDKKDMAYVSAYAELCKSIHPESFNQSKKLLNIDDKGFQGNVILPQFLKIKDPAVVEVYRRDSKRRTKNGLFTGVSNLIQCSDFLTGLTLSFADQNRSKDSQSTKHRNIYRKSILSRCKNIDTKCISKQNYYWPNFNYQKINIFYWKNKNASPDKSPSRS